MAVDENRYADLFQFFGPVKVRRMFGGAGLYSGDVMIGIVFDDLIYLKTDGMTRQAYLQERSRPFTYKTRRTGETYTTSYYSLPDRLYDDPEELARWTCQAHAVALQTEATKKKRAWQARETTTRQPARRRRGR